MGKKYLETKKNTLESSILGVWKTAIEEGDARMDGRTKQYREHRKKLESARARRVNKEEVELDEGKAKYTRKLMKNKSIVDYVKKQQEKNRKDVAKFGNKKVGASGNEPRFDSGSGWLDMASDEVKQNRMSDDKRRAFDADAEYEAIARKLGLHKFEPKLEEVDLEEAAVNPKDREELDKSPSDTAKKMKRAKDPAPNQMAEAQSGDKEAYKKFFDAALKKFKVSSPAELKDDQKKKFYDYIDKNWEGDNEKAEGAMSQVREFKMQSMKAALAQIWGMEEGKNPFAEHKGTKPHKHPHEDNEVEEGLEDSPNSANKQHLCAKNVVHEEWGSGQCISTQHADPDEEGNVAWYDVMFEHGIEKGVSINELKVTKAEGHMHASHDPKKKMKKEMSKTETGKKPAEIDLKPKLADK